VTGSTNAYFQIRAFSFELGESFSDAQLQSGAAVCVLGATVRTKLFGAQNPIGSSIRIAKVNCEVVGVTRPKGQSSFGMDQDDFVLVPLATFQRRITGSTDVGVIFLSAHDGKRIPKVKDRSPPCCASGGGSLQVLRRISMCRACRRSPPPSAP